MSSFKRRGTGAGPAAISPWPTGVRPSSFSSPVPLVSTGVPALDDILSGGGLSSGSLFVILPTTGTAALSAADIGAQAASSSAQAQSDHISRAAAEPYAELLLAYSVAQGIAAAHRGIVVGESVDAFTYSLMARAGDVEENQLQKLANDASAASAEQVQPGPSQQLGTVMDENDDDDEGEGGSASQKAEGSGSAATAQSEREMKIAWRYEKMNKFKTTVDDAAKGKDEAEAFCSTFDLSRRVSPRILQKARADGLLNTVEIDLDDVFATASVAAAGRSSYDAAFERIQQRAEECIRLAKAAPAGAPLPVLRISIRALGSPCWRLRRGQRVETEVVRFLHRLKALIRSLALPSSSSGSTAAAGSSHTSAATTPAIPAVAVMTLSPYLLSSVQPSHGSAAGGGTTTTASTPNLIHRIAHLSDACISLSAFAPSPSLRSAFSSYTGALKVLKTPALGTLTNPSVRASVLRGMGAGAATLVAARDSRTNTGETTTAGDGGAGGGENNLAFKVRRKRLVIETLHLDVEGGVSERRTKPPKNAEAASTSSGGGSGGGSAMASSSRTATATAAPVPQSGRTSGVPSSFQRRTSDNAATSAAPAPSRPSPAAASTGPGGQQTPLAPRFSGGLKSLRERGLAAAAAAEAARSPSVEVEVDTRRQSHPHSHSHSHGQGGGGGKKGGNPVSRPMFKSERMEDYEF